MKNVINQKVTDNYAIYNGDCVEIIQELDNESVDYSIFSPPFPELFTYSDSPNDMGNCKDYNEFFVHFEFLVKQLYRIMKVGRCVSIHCIDIPMMKSKHGTVGLFDFPGDIIRLFSKMGFIYHSRHTIWKQTLKDSSICRAGLPDYLITMRKPGESASPITHEQEYGFGEYIGTDDNKPKRGGVEYCHETWQKYASPVWIDIRQTHVLQKKDARESNDEKHICPLQLDTIERGIALWSNCGDVVFTPFMGIGSEIYSAVKMERKGIGIELKESYYSQAEKFIESVDKITTLF